MTVLDVIRQHDQHVDGYDHVTMNWATWKMCEILISPIIDHTSHVPSSFVLTICGHQVDLADIPNGTLRFHSPSKPFAKNVIFL